MTFKYNTKEELEKELKSFFDKYEKNNRIPSIEMLGIHLKMNRQSILNYQKKSKYSKIIGDAKDKITAFKIEAMLNNEGSTAGIIFDLKNNAGFTDKIETVNTNLDYDAVELSDKELEKIINDKQK